MQRAYQRNNRSGVLKKACTSTQLLLEEAKNHGVTWEKISYANMYKLQYKKNIHYFHGQVPSTTTAFARYCSNNKWICSDVLRANGISVNNGTLLKKNDSRAHQLEVYASLKKPLAVKPTGSARGNHVFLNIRNQKEYISAIKIIFHAAGEREGSVLVEEMFVGEEYRILATQEKILSVIKRLPANVTGDGVASIALLIALKNKDPLREKIDTYKKIKKGKRLKAYLANQGFTLDSIVSKGQKVFLYAPSSSNMNLGGDTVDVTDDIHPSVKKIIMRAMKSIPGLSLAGIDYMTQDIFSQQRESIYRIIEVNASPSFDWNEFPIQGKRRNVSYEILKIMFPEIAPL